MQSIIFLSFAYCFSFSVSDIPADSVKIDPNTILVLWGTRHGNRHPENFLAQNPRTWGFEGNTELTSFGKRQALGLGKELRKFVGNLVSENYNRSEVKYYSSSANRCQMTMQVTLAGFHRPEGWGNWDTTETHLIWAPVPYSIDDIMLRMYAVKECNRNEEVWEPIDTDMLPSLQKMKCDNVELLKYAENHTGWNMTSLSKAEDLADNLIEIDLYNASYPLWISNTSLPDYDKERMIREILAFAEVHQIACADYAPCRELMAGIWLKNILDSITDIENHKGPKVIGYASHTEITLSVMKLMGIEKDELTTSAGFVIEIRKRPSHSIRLLNHDPNPIDSHVIYLAKYVSTFRGKADQDGFIPIEDFKAFIESKVISDWKSACGIEGCFLESNKFISKKMALRRNTVKEITMIGVLLFIGLHIL